MSTLIIRSVSVISAIAIVFIAGNRILKTKEQLNPQLPQKMYTVSSLRYQAYTSAFDGQDCTVKGICVEKIVNKKIFTIYINDSENSQTVHLKCNMTNLEENEFKKLEELSEIVITGKLKFIHGLAEISDGKIISINLANL